MFRLTTEPFDAAAELKAFEESLDDAGAIVSFVGRVRPHATGSPVKTLHLQAYSPLTENGVQDIIRKACRRWPLDGVRVVHRIGDMMPGDAIVFVATASTHRRDAFEATDFIMDYLKTEAVFWKKEVSGSGSKWIEPRTEDHEAAARWQCNEPRQVSDVRK